MNFLRLATLAIALYSQHGPWCGNEFSDVIVPCDNAPYSVFVIDNGQEQNLLTDVNEFIEPLDLHQIAPPVQEDSPYWNCATMGNHICGRIVRH